MSVDDKAKPEVAAAEEGSQAEESFDDRIARSVDAQAKRLGVAEDDAAEETPESEDSGAGEEPVEEEAEAEGEAAVDAKEEKDAQPWTDDEMARFVAEDPKFFARLDKDGWARVPTHWATSYKSTQAAFTQREQRLSDRERALQGEGRPKPQDAPEQKKTAVNTAELIDALNDPERVDEAMEKLADLPGFEKAVDRLLERKGINPAALVTTSRQTVFDRGYELAVGGDDKRGVIATPALSDEAVLAEIENESDPYITALLKSGNEEATAFGFRMAAIAAEGRLAKAQPRDGKGQFAKDAAAGDDKQKSEPKDKVKKFEDAKQKVLDAKARANAATGQSAAVESSRRGASSENDPSLSLDDRIGKNLDKKLQKLGANIAP